MEIGKVVELGAQIFSGNPKYINNKEHYISLETYGSKTIESFWPFVVQVYPNEDLKSQFKGHRVMEINKEKKFSSDFEYKLSKAKKVILIPSFNVKLRLTDFKGTLI